LIEFDAGAGRLDREIDAAGLILSVYHIVALTGAGVPWSAVSCRSGGLVVSGQGTGSRPPPQPSSSILVREDATASSTPLRRYWR